jgi:ribosomal protein L7/L12
MFTPEEKSLLELLIITDLQKHALDSNNIISLNDPNTKYTLTVEELKLRRDILVKLSEMTNPINDINRITTKIPASFSYPWCPQILELNERDISNVAEYVKKGQKINAIRILRQYTKLGLKEAKDFIDLFIPSNPSIHWNDEGAGAELMRQWTNQRIRILRI